MLKLLIMAGAVAAAGMTPAEDASLRAHGHAAWTFGLCEPVFEPAQASRIVAALTGAGVTDKSPGQTQISALYSGLYAEGRMARETVKLSPQGCLDLMNEAIADIEEAERR